MLEKHPLPDTRRPFMKRPPSFSAYTSPAGGWGSVQSLGRSLARERVPVSGSRVMMHQNKPDGFRLRQLRLGQAGRAACRSSFARNGAKATTWEITRRRVRRRISLPSTRVAELEAWSDHDARGAGAG